MAVAILVHEYTMWHEYRTIIYQSLLIINWKLLTLFQLDSGLCIDLMVSIGKPTLLLEESSDRLTSGPVWVRNMDAQW